MGIDIRLPIGGMFSVIGLILVIFGLVTHGNPMYAEHSLGYNVNLWWGVAMLAFGIVMLFFGQRAERKKSSSPDASS